MKTHVRVLQVIVSCVLVFVLLRYLDWSSVRHALELQKLPYALGVGLLYVCGIVLSAVRWRIVLQLICGQVVVRLGRLICITYVGAFVNNFLPTSFGGDGARLVLLRRQGVGMNVALQSLLIDRVIGFVVLVLLVSVSAALLWPLYQSESVVRGLLVLGMVSGLLLAGLGLMVSIAPGVLRWMPSRISTTIVTLQHRVRTALPALVVAAVISGVFHGLAIAALWLLLQMVGVDRLAGAELVVAMLMPALVSVLPLSFNGIGLSEGVQVAVLVAFGVDADAAVAVALMGRVTQVLMSLIGGMIMATDRDLVIGQTES